MAALGTIGEDSMSGLFGICPLDIYLAKDISLNPVNASEPYLNLVTIAPGDRKTINGFVFDQDGTTPLQRTVLCVDQVAQQVVDVTASNPSTGAFKLRPPILNKCSVVLVPNVGDSRNAVVLSNLTPI